MLIYISFSFAFLSSDNNLKITLPMNSQDESKAIFKQSRFGALSDIKHNIDFENYFANELTRWVKSHF